MTKAKYADKEDLELAKSLETEEWVSDLPKKDKKRYEEYARTSLTKQRRINIRMTERDLERIRGLSGPSKPGFLSHLIRTSLFTGPNGGIRQRPAS